MDINSLTYLFEFFKIKINLISERKRRVLGGCTILVIIIMLATLTALRLN